ncbi:MAG TPA: hypothetical protein VFC16_19150, partial [Nakamurella sp.]|nr:hypothetical protein [Nakamurella sp.]
MSPGVAVVIGLVGRVTWGRSVISLPPTLTSGGGAEADGRPGGGFGAVFVFVAAPASEFGLVFGTAPALAAAGCETAGG